jgi:hypothetical protein
MATDPMNTPKQQHTIPRLHLQYFAGAEGRVFNYDAIAGKVWAAAPEETAVETHFYSAELADGSTSSVTLTSSRRPDVPYPTLTPDLFGKRF